jgi:hypothetical protein
MCQLYTFKICSLLAAGGNWLPISLDSLHIVFEEQVSGALQEAWRIISCHNFLILKLEVELVYGSTQQFQGFDVVGTHLTHHENNM